MLKVKKKTIYSPSEQTKKGIAKLQAELKHAKMKVRKKQKLLMIVGNLYKQ